MAQKKRIKREQKYLPQKNIKSSRVTIVIITVVGLIAVYFIYKYLFLTSTDDSSTIDEYTIGITDYKEAFDSSITQASLEFDAGAGSFNIKDTTNQLITLKADGIKDYYTIKRVDSESSSKIQFTLKDENYRRNIGYNNYKNYVDISLNRIPVWDMNFDVGAASMDFDLSEFIIKNIDVNMGAAALKIKIGSLSPETKLNIKAGASDIDILVPMESGCKITTKGAHSSKHFKEFKKINSDHYQTENIDEAVNKVYINAECGVSSISVKRY